jgi:hypothetical protein
LWPGQDALVKGGLRGIARARMQSLDTVRDMHQNLAFVFVYKARDTAARWSAVSVRRQPAAADDRGFGDGSALGACHHHGTALAW